MLKQIIPLNRNMLICFPFLCTGHMTATAATAEMKNAGNRCELVGFDGAPHGFFNRAPYFTQTLKATDTFLISLGWLKKEKSSP